MTTVSMPDDERCRLQSPSQGRRWLGLYSSLLSGCSAVFHAVVRVPRPLVVLLALLELANALDAAATWYGLQVLRVHEANPLLRAAIAVGGTAGLIGFKALVAFALGLAAGVYWRAARTRWGRVAVWTVASLICLLYLANVANNTGLLPWALPVWAR